MFRTPAQTSAAEGQAHPPGPAPAPHAEAHPLLVVGDVQLGRDGLQNLTQSVRYLMMFGQ